MPHNLVKADTEQTVNGCKSPLKIWSAHITKCSYQQADKHDDECTEHDPKRNFCALDSMQDLKGLKLSFRKVRNLLRHLGGRKSSSQGLRCSTSRVLDARPLASSSELPGAIDLD